VDIRRLHFFDPETGLALQGGLGEVEPTRAEALTVE
jgi:hypothetical protein